MFIKLSSSVSFFSLPVQFVQQDRLKAIVSYLAIGILFTGAVYWVYSRFWQNYRLKKEGNPKLSYVKSNPSPVYKIFVDDKRQTPKERSPKISTELQKNFNLSKAGEEPVEEPQIVSNPSSEKLLGLEIYDFKKNQKNLVGVFSEEVNDVDEHLNDVDEYLNGFLSDNISPQEQVLKNSKNFFDEQRATFLPSESDFPY